MGLILFLFLYIKNTNIPTNTKTNPKKLEDFVPMFKIVFPVILKDKKNKLIKKLIIIKNNVILESRVFLLDSNLDSNLVSRFLIFSSIFFILLVSLNFSLGPGLFKKSSSSL